jgi:hypothetical protein
MKNNASKQLRMSATLFRSGLVMGTALLALAWMPASAKENEHSRGRNHREKEVQYRQTNLVADLPGVALLQDTNLVNAWGVSFSPTSPFWISDNGTGLATLYAVTNDSLGTVFVTKLSTQVSIPGDGTPTGQVFNSNSNAFHGDLFILASEDGTISGWRGAPAAPRKYWLRGPTPCTRALP